MTKKYDELVEEVGQIITESISALVAPSTNEEYSRVEAVIANKMADKLSDEVTIAGKYCEPGDVLIRDITMPPVSAGDIIAVAGCGAYSIPEAMNYNASFKPAVVLVKEGKARLIRRRETLEDLTRCDLV